MTDYITIQITPREIIDQDDVITFDYAGDMEEVSNVLTARGFLIYTVEEDDDRIVTTYRNGDGSYLDATHDVDVTEWITRPDHFTPLDTLALPE